MIVARKQKSESTDRSFLVGQVLEILEPEQSYRVWVFGVPSKAKDQLNGSWRKGWKVDGKPLFKEILSDKGKPQKLEQTVLSKDILARDFQLSTKGHLPAGVREKIQNIKSK